MLPFCRRQNNICTPKWWTFSHVLLLEITSSIYTYNPNYIQSAVWNSRFFLGYHIQEVFQTVMLALSPSRWWNLSSKYLSPQISICVFCSAKYSSLPLMHIARTQRTCLGGLLQTDMTEMCQIWADQKWMCNSSPARFTSFSLMSHGWFRALLTPVCQIPHCHNQTGVVGTLDTTLQGEKSWEDFEPQPRWKQPSLQVLIWL